MRKCQSVNASKVFRIIEKVEAGFKSFKNHAHVQLSEDFTRKQGKLQFNLHRITFREIYDTSVQSDYLEKYKNLSTLLHGIRNLSAFIPLLLR